MDGVPSKHLIYNRERYRWRYVLPSLIKVITVILPFLAKINSTTKYDKQTSDLLFHWVFEWHWFITFSIAILLARSEHSEHFLWSNGASLSQHQRRQSSVHIMCDNRYAIKPFETIETLLTCFLVSHDHKTAKSE